jgi:hypothetical protein
MLLPSEALVHVPSQNPYKKPLSSVQADMAGRGTPGTGTSDPTTRPATAPEIGAAMSDAMRNVTVRLDGALVGAIVSDHQAHEAAVLRPVQARRP